MEGDAFCQGLSGAPQSFSSTVGHFVYGGPGSRARISTNLILFHLSSPQERARGRARQPQWLPADASRTTTQTAGPRGWGARTTGCNVKWVFFTRVNQYKNAIKYFTKKYKTHTISYYSGFYKYLRDTI